MFVVNVPAREYWDDNQEMFIYSKEDSITIEHSLHSLYLWEAKYGKPFLSTERTPAETLDYIKLMTTSKVSDPNVYDRLTNKNLTDIANYMNAPMTATWFRKDDKKPNKSIITAEIIYYWMISFEIPFECQYWHLNRLLTLIRVCNEKNKDPKKLSKNELYSRNAALNAARRKKFNSRG